jgi:predicted ATPase/DNA-binding XRE family transcriptional regulator
LTSDARLPFGTLLRQLRIEAGLSQEALAERARISLDTVGALERGRRQAPHRETLSLICEGLGLGPEQHDRLELAAAASRKIGRPRLNAAERGAVPGVAVAEPHLEAHHNLPYAVNSFHGRERELAELAASLQSRRVVTLHGPGGVGKTRLAIEAARVQLESEKFADGAWFVDLATVSDPNAVTIAIAHALDVREIPDEPLADTLVAALHDRHVLLVLDNCEHVLEAAAQIVHRLAQACPGLRVLVTSREPLEIEGELVYRVEPLGLPAENSVRERPPRSLAELRASPAVNLFLDRAHDADPHFFMTSAANDPEAIVTICQRLDGLPLTLELAAARVRDLTLAEICEGLDNRFGLLARGKRSAQPRHRTLRAMVEWSYALLSDDQQRIFRRLGAFAGNWTLEAAAAVSGEPAATVRDAVATLVSKSLVGIVHGHGGPQRYRLLESLRAFARALEIERGEDAATSRAHAEYFRDRARSAAREPSGAFDALLVDIADVRAALEWSVGARNDVVLGADLTSVLADAWAERGLDAEGLRLLGAARVALKERTAPGTPSLRVRDVPPEPAGRETAEAPAWLAAFGPERSYAAGDVIFHAGEDAAELFYVVSGTIAVEEIGLELGPHDVLGEIAFFSARHRRTATAVCRTPVVVRSLGQEALLELYDHEPSFRRSIIAVLTRRLLQDLETGRARKAEPEA